MAKAKKPVADGLQSLTIKVPGDLHRRAWKWGTDQKPRVTLSEMVRTSLDDYLRKRGA